MADGSMFEVDTEELRAAGSGMLRVGDSMHAAATAGVLLGNGAYGGSPLSPAAGRFADRFAYLVGGLGDGAIDAGHAMRGSADGYEEMDAVAGYTFDGLGPDTP